MKVMVILQIICALALLNVWILRNKKITNYRGGNAKNLKEEFQAYGLPVWIYYLVGFLKISSACLLIAGIWLPILVLPIACLILILMLGALTMHIKVHDPLLKSVPAILMLIISLALIIGRMHYR
jgi:hypothetical protein